MHVCEKTYKVFNSDRRWAGGLGVLSLQCIPLYTL